CRLRLLARSGEHEAAAPQCLEPRLGRAGCGELAAEIADVDVDHVLAGTADAAPERVEDRAAAEDFLGVVEEMLEQQRLAFGKGDGAFGPAASRRSGV